MAPNVVSTSVQEEHHEHEPETKPLEPVQIVWRNVFLFIGLHAAAIYGLYLVIAHATLTSWFYGVFLSFANGLGITAGAHRLWTHRSYKAKLPLRIFLAFCNCLALQNDIYEWSRDHRVHHKFAETNADPHNVNRGFFFAHMGWLMAKKQKDVIEKGKTVDISDIWADPVVRFQHRFYVPLAAICCFVIPSAIPYYCWNEDWYASVFGAGFLRYVLCLHFTWFVNSAAHLWGNKPYDKYISATESKWVSAFAIGEGFHNYHHTFPWDYATSELGYKYNFTTFFIDCMAYIGQAYDLKTTNPESIHQRKIRTGDGSYFIDKDHKE
ncbi:acyl-CoA Delta-9 desaturase [Parasteatoda tepidariorum]|uniref:acyl-CoA Delta-9 desaturase n=1 Tax=Parasteatoda tepidariorum TaxID=114398 RepID=UPI00077FD8C3|nr:acyl-CoA Delta-9 desaturase [Parasteatoda tepidariorum]